MKENLSENHELQELKSGKTENQNGESKQTVKHSDTLFLYFTMLTGILLMLAASTTLAWTSPAVVQMQTNDTINNPLRRPITTKEISCLVGIPQMISLLGSAVLPKLADIIGRKRSLQVAGFILFFCNIGLAFSKRIEVMVVFSSIFQFFAYAVWNIIPIYVTEICEDHNRAKYSCLIAVSIPLGQLYVYTTGSAFSITTFTLLTSIPLICSQICFLFIPESPIYLLSKGKYQESILALTKLRNNKSDKDIQIDFNSINSSILKEFPQNHEYSIIKKLFTTKEGRVGLLLGTLAILGQYLSGQGAIISLLAPIFDEPGTGISGNSISVIVGVVEVFSFIATSLFVGKTGKKSMYFISGIGSGISLLSLGTVFYLKHTKYFIIEQFQWISLVCILSYFIFFSIGLGVIPLSIIGELFASDTRSAGVTILATSTGFIYVVNVSLYPLFAEMIGTYGCMWIFGGTCILFSVLYILLMPETNGKNITEIQELLRNYKIFK